MVHLRLLYDGLLLPGSLLFRLAFRLQFGSIQLGRLYDCVSLKDHFIKTKHKST